MATAEKLDWLIADQLRAGLPGAVIGERNHCPQRNWIDKRCHFARGIRTRSGGLQAAVVSDEGLVLFAEHQTAGRGQRGNRWESTKGKGLWFSILLRPEIQLHDSGRLDDLGDRSDLGHDTLRARPRARNQVSERRSALWTQSSRRPCGNARPRERVASGCGRHRN